jgi:hypothetical protein
METTTAGAMKEKDNIRKIKFLKESKAYIEEINRLRDIISEKKK